MNPEAQITGMSRQTTAREFLAIMFRRKAVILGLFAVTTATVLLISFTTPVEYVSSGRVLIKRGEKESMLSSSRRSTGDWEEEMGSEVEVVKSAPVLDRARALLAEEAGAGRASIQLNADNVDVEVRGRTNVVGIGYVDADPLVARLACDAVVRAYVEYRQNDFSLAVPRDFFEGEIRRVQDEMDHWVANRRNFAERSNVVDLAMQRNSDIARMSMLRERLNEVEADLAEADMGWKKLGELQGSENFDQPSFSTLFGNETALMELKRRVVDQEFHVASLREKLRDDAPEVAAATVTLDTLRGMMRREVQSRIGASKARVEVLQARRSVMMRDIAELDRGLALMPDKEMSIVEMDRRIGVLKERYKELSESSDKVRITQNTSPSRNVVLLARASEPIARNTRDYVRLALAPVFSIVVGIGLAFFLDGLDLTVRTARQAEEAVELPVLASLTERRRKRRRTPDLAEAAAA
ncbi:MAG: hypothetical protein ABIS67_12275 [Candidatus Eisenbacteria bacterium]